MAGDINSTAEVGVMLRGMGDRYANQAAEEYAQQVSDKLAAVVEGFEPTGDDVADAKALSQALADHVDQTDFTRLEARIGQALFQAGAIGMASTPLVETQKVGQE